jgi:16S rRNA (guanine966-N2)-methyltransferase
MRVIAGRYSGRRLTAPKGSTTRPTSERVREALYAMLGDIEDARVLDLFAGSGALGIEAVSRGAAGAVFVERDRGAIAAIAANIAALGLSEEQALIRREDVASALRRASDRKETYDLILIDPPYGRAPELEPLLTAALGVLLAPGARVVLESDRRAPLQLGLAFERERRYGDTIIAIHRHE